VSALVVPLTGGAAAGRRRTVCAICVICGRHSNLCLIGVNRWLSFYLRDL
jgi:hypothetical protein